MLLSLGNNVYTHSKLEIFAAFVAICGLVLTPPLREFEWFIFETHAQPYREGNIIALWHFLRIVSLIIGCSLLFLQLCNIVRFIIPDSRLTNSKLLTSLLRGSSVRSEFGIKQAAIYKVHEMVKNAYELHVIDSDRQSFKVHRIDDDDDDDSKIELTKDPLLNFTRVTEKRQSRLVRMESIVSASIFFCILNSRMIEFEVEDFFGLGKLSYQDRLLRKKVFGKTLFRSFTLYIGGTQPFLSILKFV